MASIYRLFSFNIFVDYYRALKNISKRDRIPISQIINSAIRAYIEWDTKNKQRELE